MSNEKFKLGTVDAILAINDVETEDVDVPEWGCKVRVKGLTKGEEFKIRKASVSKTGVVDDKRFELLTFVAGVVEPKFETHHIDLLAEKSSGAMNRILKAILEKSNVDASALEEAEADFPDTLS